MPQRTKKAIVQCTLALAARKPISKITVREITEACELTRNTFYYHFHDIYEVIIYFFESQAEERLAGSLPLETRLMNFIELCSGYKHIWVNLYKSVGHEQFYSYVVSLVHKLLMEEIAKGCCLSDFPQGDLEIICSVYEEAIVGVLIRWLRNRKDESPEALMAMLKRAGILFEGQVRMPLERSLNSEK